VPIWLARTTVRGAQMAILHSQRLTGSYPQGIVMLTLVGNDAHQPDSAAVKLLAAHMSNIAGHIQHSAVVFEGVGFRAAFIRAITTGLSLLANHPYPHRVCSFDSAVGGVALAMTRANGSPVAPASVRRAVEELRGDVMVPASHARPPEP
jgi:hypothetical protein